MPELNCFYRRLFSAFCKRRFVARISFVIDFILYWIPSPFNGDVFFEFDHARRRAVHFYCLGVGRQ